MRIPASARLALLPVLALATACPTYYPTYPPYPGGPASYPGNIAVSWTFAGNTCSQTPGVAQVVVSVPSDPIPIYPNTFPCSVGILPGQLVIYGYAPGNYTVNLTALDSNGNTIWTGSGTAVVVANQTVSIAIDLEPAGSSDAGASDGVAYLSWEFSPGLSSYSPPCTAAGDSDPDRMDTVALYVDGATSPAQTYDCSAGLGVSQVSTPALIPGSHSLQLVASQSGLDYVFAQTQPVAVTISASGPTSQGFTFVWQVGGVGVAWTYPDPNACSTGGVASVNVAFNADGGSGYAVTGWPCNTAVAPFKRLPAVPTGSAMGVTYSLSVDALGAPPSPVLYSGTASSVTIVPGQFYDGTSATVANVPLN